MTLLLDSRDICKCKDCPFCDDFNWCKSLHKKVDVADGRREDCPLIHLDDETVLDLIRSRKG